MTDQDYINAKALGTITAAINTLRDLCPEILKAIIKEGESQTVFKMLFRWRDRLYDEIKIEEEGM